MADMVRASDAEREALVDRLRHAAAEGRLDADELERRVSGAYGATSRAELDALVADLPAPPAPPAPPPARVDGEELRRRVAGFITPNLVCIIIWLATGA